MKNILLRRLLILYPLTLLGAITIIFLIIHLIPGDPVLVIMSDYYTRESYEALQHKLGLDRPLYVQYVDYLWRVIHLDLGESFQNKRPVIQNIAEQFPFTVHLALASLVVTLTIALPVGVISALYRNQWPDYLSMFPALLAVSSPVFVVAILLLLVFSLRLGWLPSFGVGEEGNLYSLLLHLVLPALALGSGAAALLARVTRSAMLDVLSQDYIRTARAKGLRERIVLYRHALSNALIPIVTVIGIDIAYLLGGAVIIETVFSRRGVGRVLVSAILTRDFPQIQGTLLIFISLTVIVSSGVDLLYVWLDPRIKYS